MQSLLGSARPRLRISRLFGTQYQKAALRVVPPSSAAFSRRMTSFPNQRENNAAESPPAPPPTIMTSASESKEVGATGVADRRGAIECDWDIEKPPARTLHAERERPLRPPPE